MQKNASKASNAWNSFWKRGERLPCVLGGGFRAYRTSQGVHAGIKGWSYVIYNTSGYSRRHPARLIGRLIAARDWVNASPSSGFYQRYTEADVLLLIAASVTIVVRFFDFKQNRPSHRKRVQGHI